MKKIGNLSTREEELLNILWAYNEPLTQNEMVDRLVSQGWNNVTLFKTVQSLAKAGYLKVVGLEKSVKTYARKFIPSLTKEEFYSELLIKKGMTSDSLPDITAALIGANKKENAEQKREVIAKLEEIIESLRKEIQE